MQPSMHVALIFLLGIFRRLGIWFMESDAFYKSQQCTLPETGLLCDI